MQISPGNHTRGYSKLNSDKSKNNLTQRYSNIIHNCNQQLLLKKYIGYLLLKLSYFVQYFIKNQYNYENIFNNCFALYSLHFY